jgi:hypothetical protein
MVSPNENDTTDLLSRAFEAQGTQKDSALAVD